MHPEIKLLNNDRGSIMVVALLLLVFLTIIGITAASNTRMELNITRNSQEYKRDFYLAHAQGAVGEHPAAGGQPP